jgi:eukaryotic-like serine/threonine-protein kinase
LASQLADYEITSSVLEDGTTPCLRARRPARLGGDNAPVTIWILGPLARTPWTLARSRLEPVAAVRGDNLPKWLEAGVADWAERPVIWVSASTAVSGTLASPPPGMDVPAQLRAIAAAARGAHSLHEQGQLHGAICPQAIALVSTDQGDPPVGDVGTTSVGTTSVGTTSVGTTSTGSNTAVLAPPSLANGERPVAQVGYPPLAFMDPQLLRGEGGRWSDIWALGATVHQVVAGSAPFQGIEEVPVVQALSRLLTAPAPGLGQLPAAVAELVASCLAVDPAVRPLTASDVATRLDEAAAKW